ncbi:NAD(+) salvage pathway protein [Steccherinum ochraceum]|uniref:nicotinamidase n=1 Tax=Steccherinum ochraceum TaxID=92696 RepID=A0A4R0RNI2_9APHY|nr:NAD(+) salvage pathway protein [Steccherinum ochraceum]
MSSSTSTFTPALLIIDVQEDFCPPNGSLAVPDGRAILPTINYLLTLPFPAHLKLATKDHHPPTHISFHTSPHHSALTTPLTPFTSTVTIANPYNPNETYVSHVWPPHCVVGTPGNEFAKGLDVGSVGRVVLKGRDERVEMYSAFRTPLRDPPLEKVEPVCKEHGEMGEVAKVLVEEGVTDVVVVGLAGDYCVKASALDCVEIAREVGRTWRCWVVEEGVRCVGGEKAWEETKKELKKNGVQVVSLAQLKQVKKSVVLHLFPESSLLALTQKLFPEVAV